MVFEVNLKGVNLLKMPEQKASIEEKMKAKASCGVLTIDLLGLSQQKSLLTDWWLYWVSGNPVLPQEFLSVRFSALKKKKTLWVCIF